MSHASARPSAETERPHRPGARARQLFPSRARAGVAFLPREMASRMHDRLELIKIAPRRVLDAGCGPGDDFPGLRERFPAAPMFGPDLSMGCCTRAMQARRRRHELAALTAGFARQAAVARGPRFAQADFSALPFAAGAFELIWSNLALHWHPQPDRVFPEWRRVLRVDSLLMFSTLGPDTLKELQGAYRRSRAPHAPPSVKHVIDFVDMHDLGDLLVESGFEIPVMDQEDDHDHLQVTASRWAQHGAPLRGVTVQAREADANQASIPAARRLHKALLGALEARRGADGTIPLTFEVIYGHAWKAVPRITPPKDMASCVSRTLDEVRRRIWLSGKEGICYA